MTSSDHIPLVSVVMPVYNGEKYVRQTMESILRQTFTDFEFLIVDDGSTDRTFAIVQEYAANDSRIIAIHQENKGKPATRNILCALARGTYIAVTDSDDISLPERLQEEVRYMEAHPQIGVVGTWAECIDGTGRVTKVLRHPCSPAVAVWSLFLRNPISHSAALIRRSAGEDVGWYRDYASDDYDLWSRISANYDIANIPQILVQYRVWAGNFTAMHEGAEEATARIVIRERSALLLGEDISEDSVRALRLVMEGGQILSSDQISMASSLCRRLSAAFMRSRPLSFSDRQQIRTIVSEYYFLLARHAARYSFWWMVLLCSQALVENPLFLCRMVPRTFRRFIGALQKKFSGE